MRPLRDPTPDFAASNPFVLAVLGVTSVAQDISSFLAGSMPTAADEREPSGAPISTAPMERHELDLALLGVVSLSTRLSARVAMSSDDELSSAFHDIADLLR